MATSNSNNLEENVKIKRKAPPLTEFIFRTRMPQNKNKGLGVKKMINKFENKVLNPSPIKGKILAEITPSAPDVDYDSDDGSWGSDFDDDIVAEPSPTLEAQEDVDNDINIMIEAARERVENLQNSRFRTPSASSDQPTSLDNMGSPSSECSSASDDAPPLPSRMPEMAPNLIRTINTTMNAADIFVANNFSNSNQNIPFGLANDNPVNPLWNENLPAAVGTTSTSPQSIYPDPNALAKNGLELRNDLDANPNATNIPPLPNRPPPSARPSPSTRPQVSARPQPSARPSPPVRPPPPKGYPPTPPSITANVAIELNKSDVSSVLPKNRTTKNRFGGLSAPKFIQQIDASIFKIPGVMPHSGIIRPGHVLHNTPSETRHVQSETSPKVPVPGFQPAAGYPIVQSRTECINESEADLHLEDKNNDIVNLPWFHQVTWHLAQEKLKVMMLLDGVFLVRPSSRSAEGIPFTVSVCVGGRIINCHVFYTAGKKYILGKPKPGQKSFDSLVELVGYYQTTPAELKISDARAPSKVCFLITPPKDSDEVYAD